jgi:outer membrane protein TolC
MVRNSLHILIALSFFLLSFTHSAQDTTQYTLQEVIKIAHDQSPDAQIAKHQYRKSYWGFRSFKATYLPGLLLEATIPNIDQRIEAVTAQDGSRINTPISFTGYQIGLSLNQKIGFTGGTISLNSGLSRLTDNRADSIPTQFYSNIISVRYNQPIFTYNPYKWDKRIEPMKFEEAQRIYIETAEQVAIAAVDHFFSLLLAQIQVGIAWKNQGNYDTLFRIAQGRYNLGKIAENELLQLELNLLQADASVETAELNYESRLFEFKSYLRINNNEEIRLLPPLMTEHFKVLTQKAIIEAKNNSSAELEFRRRLLEAESQVNFAKMDGRFDANLFAMFGLTQTSSNLPDAYKNPLDEEVVTLGITLPLLDWGKARGMIKLAQSNQAMVETSVEQEKIDFEQSVFLQVMQFNMQEKQLKIAAKSDTVAQKRFEITQKRYMIGKVNDVLELNLAQIDNDNAKIGYYRALLIYWKSYYELRKLTHYDFQRDMPIIVSFDELTN